MPCYKPKQAWRSSELGPSGKARIIWAPDPAHYCSPIELPCGQCIGCRLERSQMWAMRAMAEASMHTDNCMVTTTYRNDELPWDHSLIKEHHQAFIRSLRDRNPGKTIRYYMAGEYGEATLDNDFIARPHYHVCLFGYQPPDLELFSRHEGLDTFTSEYIADVWGKGFCTVSPLTFSTAAYAARYCLKKITGEAAADHYTRTHHATGEIIQIEPEYNAMSLKPAIGKEWFDKYHSDCYPSDFLINRGSKVAVPRYFDKLYQIRDPDGYEAIKRNRVLRARAHKENNTPERLAVREKCKTLQVKKLSRKL